MDSPSSLKEMVQKLKGILSVPVLRLLHHSQAFLLRQYFLVHL